MTQTSANKTAMERVNGIYRELASLSIAKIQGEKDWGAENARDDALAALNTLFNELEGKQ